MASIKKILLIGGAFASMLAGLSAVPARANDGGAIAAGVLGGLAVGAIAGSAAANNGYRPGYGYGYAPAYAPPGGCYFTRQPVYDDYGYVVGHRRVRVCE